MVSVFGLSTGETRPEMLCEKEAALANQCSGHSAQHKSKSDTKRTN
jgi:hypothetical protein